MIIPSLSLQGHCQHVDYTTAASPLQSHQFNETRETFLKPKMVALVSQQLDIRTASLGLDRG